MKPKIIFAGSGQFAVPILRTISSHADLPLVLTQPARPAGKGNKLCNTPLFETALELKLPTATPDKLEDLNEKIKDLNPDLIIVTDYGALIKKSTLEIPKYGVINIHPSLLPKYRGPSPIQSALLNGDKQTGISIMLIDDKMDHGPLLAQFEYDIPPNADAITLENELATLSAKILPNVINQYLAGIIQPKPQNHTEATFCKLIKKEDGLILESDTIQNLINKTKALQPWPGVWLTQEFKNKKLRINIIETGKESILKSVTNNPKLISFNKKVYLQLKDGLLRISQLKPEGKGVMTDQDFSNGYQLDQFSEIS